MMESFLEDAENSLHHRATGSDGSYSSDSDSTDDPFLYDKFLPDPDWRKAEEEERTASQQVQLVDPGAFRYNKRVFVTSLPAMLFVLALGGETLVLMAAVATALVTIMTQLGESKRCVVTFIITFIPCHAYVLGSVLPLLWLSMWHLLLVVIINAFVILTGGWVLLQFQAFRMEETFLASIIEQMLFTAYPVLSTGLVTWALSAVLDSQLIPVTFSLMWFVLLQLYLVPTLSSFRSQTTADENLDVVQVPVVTSAVVLFVLLGPAMHVVLAVCGADTPPLLSLTSLTHLAFILCLSSFLSTLLSIRQIFEYMGLPFTTAVYTRWVSGVLCTALCYPVLHTYGLDSHFLPLLPVAIAMFAALGVVLAFKKRRMIMAVLAVVLLLSLASLFMLWIQRMPHNLQHYFMGVFPLNVFYVMICSNFFLCLLSLWNASVDNKRALGTLLFTQSLVLNVCELSLHNGGLYSTSLLQLTSVFALYSLHRLHTAERISRGAAILTSSVHSAKSLASGASIVLTGRGDINLTQHLVLMLLSVAVLSLFVYTCPEVASVSQVVGQLVLLLVSMAVSAPYLLTPLSMIMFQGSSSYTNIFGLWCLVCGAMTLLYTQTLVGSDTHFSSVVIKLSLLLSTLGLVVMVLQPHASTTWISAFQWTEILSLFSLAALLSTQPRLSPTYLLLVATVFSICPGLRLCLFLWSSLPPLTAVLCVVVSASLLSLLFLCFLPADWTTSTETMMKTTLTTSCMAAVSVLCLDLVAWFSAPGASTLTPRLPLFQLPAWTLLLTTTLVISVVLKVTHVYKGVSKLPLTGSTDSTRPPLLPLLGNITTVLTFTLACTQGPYNPTLRDLWCCASTVVLGCLHKDSITLPSLSGRRQATPTIMAAVGLLVVSTLVHSKLWAMGSGFQLVVGLLEVLLALFTLPVFYVMWGLLWKGEVISEPAVVFLAPYPFLLAIIASSYAGWFLAAAALFSAAWMMTFHLPMVPYNQDDIDFDR